MCLCGLVSSYRIAGNALTNPLWVLRPSMMDKFGALVQHHQRPRTNTHPPRREWSDDFFVQPSNTVKELLKIKELDFSGAQNELPFQGKKPPSKPMTRRKIQHLWGISLSARTRMSRHILDGYFTSTCGLGAGSLQSFTKCPLRQQRRSSGARLASRML